MSNPWNGIPPDPSKAGYHWLRSKRTGELVPLEWDTFEWSRGSIGNGASPGTMAAYATYHAPCVPPELPVELEAA